MKIGLITNFLPSTGAGRYAFELFKNLKNKIDAELIFCNGFNDEFSNTKIKNIRGWNFPVFRTSLNSYFSYPKRIPDGYDLYHISNQFLARTAKFRSPSIITILDLVALVSKDLPFLTRYLQKKSLKYLKNTQKIIAISEHTKRDLIDLLNIEEDKIEVIYLGFNQETFKNRDKMESRKKLNLPQDKKIILHVGSEEPRKNVDGLIKAFSKLQNKINNTLLVRVGEKTDEIENLINDLNVRKKIIRNEKISEEKLSLYYNAADLFVFPSFYEGFGFPPLEAMASGTPVISSNKTSLPEVIGDAGIMIDPNNINELASKMYEVLINKKLREDMIKKGLKRAELFSWKECAKKTLKVYNEVLEIK
jgi:glycosyltransferase involved in cell wall biosynthesis